jgi:6-phosphogluconate dehydrogenase (decarboxylating)
MQIGVVGPGRMGADIGGWLIGAGHCRVGCDSTAATVTDAAVPAMGQAAGRGGAATAIAASKA